MTPSRSRRWTRSAMAASRETAIVRVKPAPGQLARIPELAAEIPQVGKCNRITGEDCFYLTVHLRSIDELSELLDRFLAHGETTTSLIAPVQSAAGKPSPHQETPRRDPGQKREQRQAPTGGSETKDRRKPENAKSLKGLAETVTRQPR
jgi:DNA-binding Lrp family transcriptional regulator